MSRRDDLPRLGRRQPTAPMGVAGSHRRGLAGLRMGDAGAQGLSREQVLLAVAVVLSALLGAAIGGGC